MVVEPEIGARVTVHSKLLRRVVVGAEVVRKQHGYLGLRESPNAKGFFGAGLEEVVHIHTEGEAEE